MKKVIKKNVLYQILTTAEGCQTISDIAKKLYLSQPYVSQVLSKAEEQYNVVLIQRRTLPITVTEAGRTLRRGLSRLNSDQMKIEQDLRRFSKDEQTYIKIGFSPVWVAGQTTHIIPMIQKHFPSTRFELIKTFSVESAKRLVDNHMVDIYWGPLLRGENYTNHFFYNPASYLIIPKTSKLYDKSKKEVKFDYDMLVSLSQEPMVSLSDDSSFQHSVDHMMDDQHLEVNKLIRVNDYDGAAQLAAYGFGWTITNEYIIPNLTESDEYNYAKLPNSLIPSDNGLTVHKEATEKAKQIAEVMVEDISELLTKQGKIVPGRVIKKNQ